jgi:hypothetical protein
LHVLHGFNQPEQKPSPVLKQRKLLKNTRNTSRRGHRKKLNIQAAVPRNFTLHYTPPPTAGWNFSVSGFLRLAGQVRVFVQICKRGFTVLIFFIVTNVPICIFYRRVFHYHYLQIVPLRTDIFVILFLFEMDFVSRGCDLFSFRRNSFYWNNRLHWRIPSLIHFLPRIE